jgi:hypothetical protein
MAGILLHLPSGAQDEAQYMINDRCRWIVLNLIDPI